VTESLHVESPNSGGHQGAQTLVEVVRARGSFSVQNTQQKHVFATSEGFGREHVWREAASGWARGGESADVSVRHLGRIQSNLRKQSRG